MSTTQIWTNIIAYILQIGLLVGIGAALPVLLRLGGGGRAPRARLLYWQFTLIACLALPWLRPWQLEVITLSNTAVAANQVIATLAKSAPPGFSLPPVMEISLWLLAAGVVVRLGWLATGLIKLARYRRRGQGMPLPPEWNNSARQARLLLSDEIGGPVTFGFFRPVVLLPANFPSMPAAMRDAILFHELIHVERRDWLFTLGEELVRTVFWFHPAIWWLLGEIQLAREQTVDQAVIEMTQARDPYVDTLLAMAGISTEPDLAPAPLFLRRRHLKQRVLGIIQEAGMSKTRLIFAQIAALTMVAVACWFVTGAVPLHAQAQMVADGAGVTVNLNGSQLMHRSPVAYPVEALMKGVEGTVVVQVRLDANGEVIDDAILSGPDELRKGVQQSVLTWHFDKNAGASTRVVNIDFVKPPSPAVPGAAIPTFAQRVAPPPATAPGQSINVATSAEKLAQIQEDARQVQIQRLQQMAQTSQNQPAAGQQRKIEDIVVDGLSDSARERLLAQLPVHAGDLWSPELASKTTDAARAFDSHLSTRVIYLPDGNSELQVVAQQTGGVFGQLGGVRGGLNAATAQPSSAGAPAGSVTVGSGTMAAKLINAVKPTYPPLAKMARQQGTVNFEATIAKDGTVEDLKLVSGPPLLVPAAMEAVRQWIYSPTMMNGTPVEVFTSVDVNFSLSN